MFHVNTNTVKLLDKILDDKITEVQMNRLICPYNRYDSNLTSTISKSTDLTIIRLYRHSIITGGLIGININVFPSSVMVNIPLLNYNRSYPSALINKVEDLAKLVISCLTEAFTEETTKSGVSYTERFLKIHNNDGLHAVVRYINESYNGVTASVYKKYGVKIKLHKSKEYVYIYAKWVNGSWVYYACGPMSLLMIQYHKLRKTIDIHSAVFNNIEGALKHITTFIYKENKSINPVYTA